MILRVSIVLNTSLEYLGDEKLKPKSATSFVIGDDDSDEDGGATKVEAETQTDVAMNVQSGIMLLTPSGDNAGSLTSDVQKTPRPLAECLAIFKSEVGIC